MSLENQVKSMLNEHAQVQLNPSRKALIQATVENREVMVAANGAVATWTPPESTGRSPKDTVIVKRAVSEGNIDWDSPNNIPIDEETFDMLFADALATLSRKECLYVTDRVIGADVLMPCPPEPYPIFPWRPFLLIICSGKFRKIWNRAFLPGVVLPCWFYPMTNLTVSAMTGGSGKCQRE
ncbi:MAG: hypothetical protein DRG80_00600 [Deltaproteobacteria bacterium]|nr:MAG: hypothetical protein DRG80_00600 [Deltaproteobacteria bacterium]